MRTLGLGRHDAQEAHLGGGVAQGAALGGVLLGVEDAAVAQRGYADVGEALGEGDVPGDDEIARHRVLLDVAVGGVGAGGDEDGERGGNVGELADRDEADGDGRAAPHEDGADVARGGVPVNPDRHEKASPEPTRAR